MNSRRRFIKNLSSGLFLPVALHGSTPIPFGFWQSNSPASYDAEVLDWVSRVIGLGGTVSDASKGIANTLMLGFKAFNLRIKILWCQIYAGSFAGLPAPFIKDIGSTTCLVLNFVSGDYAETGSSGGLTGNTSNTKAIYPGFNLASAGAITINDVHCACYVRTGTNEGGACMAQQQVPNDTALMPANGGTSYWDCSNASSARISVSDSNGKGFYVGTRTASNSSVLYKNGVSIASTTNAGGSFPAAGLGNQTFAIHGVGDSGLGFAASTSRTLSFASVGLGLTATDVSNLNSLVQAAQDSWSRKVV